MVPALGIADDAPPRFEIRDGMRYVVPYFFRFTACVCVLLHAASQPSQPLRQWCSRNAFTIVVVAVAFGVCSGVKARWIGRTLLDVCTREFVAYPEHYFRAAIAAGRVTLDGNVAHADSILKTGQQLVRWRPQHRLLCARSPLLGVRARSTRHTCTRRRSLPLPLWCLPTHPMCVLCQRVGASCAHACL